MLEILIRPRARKDLAAIWQYTFEQWGETQADLYLRELEIGIQILADHPDFGVLYDHVRAGYRKLHLNRHMVFYRVKHNRIEVVRILHESMDVPRRL